MDLPEVPHRLVPPEAVEAEVERLETAVGQRRAADAAEAAEDDRARDDYDAPRKVTLSQRAVPLLEQGPARLTKSTTTS